MASDDAGSVLKSPGAAESQRCIVGASPPRRRRDEPIAVTANHRQTKAAELKRLSGGGGEGGATARWRPHWTSGDRKSGKGPFGFRRNSRQLQLEGDAVKKGAFYSTQVPLIRTKEAHNLLTQRSKGPDGGDGEPGCL